MYDKSWVTNTPTSLLVPKPASKVERLEKLAVNSPEYNGAEYQFTMSWRHVEKKRPPIRHIYKIVLTPEIWESYVQYRWVAELLLIFWLLFLSVGTETRGFLIVSETGPKSGTNSSSSIVLLENVPSETAASTLNCVRSKGARCARLCERVIASRRPERAGCE